MAQLYRKKRSGRKKAAWEVKNTDRGWQLAVLELGRRPENAERDLFAWFCTMW